MHSTVYAAYVGYDYSSLLRKVVSGADVLIFLLYIFGLCIWSYPTVANVYRHVCVCCVCVVCVFVCVYD